MLKHFVTLTLLASIALALACTVRAEQNTVTVWITNSNGSQTPVKLLKNGPNYIGPGGEHYNGMPTEEDLKKLYGR